MTVVNWLLEAFRKFYSNSNPHSVAIKREENQIRIKARSEIGAMRLSFIRLKR